MIGHSRPTIAAPSHPGEIEKKSAKSRKISSKAAYIPVAARSGRCGQAQGLFGDMDCGTLDEDALGLIEGG